MNSSRTNGTRPFDGDGRSMSELFRDLASGTQTLISKEIRLARLEMKESVKNAGMGAGLFAGAAVFGLVGLIALAFTMVAVLSLILPVWLAAMIVTVLYFAIAGILAILGKSRLNQASPVPGETIQTLKEDQEWLKQQVS